MDDGLIKEVGKVLYTKEQGKDKGFYLNIKANFRVGDLVELDQVLIGSV